MGTSGTSDGPKKALVPTWVNEPAAPPAESPHEESGQGNDTQGPDQKGDASEGNESPEQEGVGDASEGYESPGPEDEGGGEIGASPAKPTVQVQPYPKIPAVPKGSGLQSARANMTRGARTSSSREIRRAASRYVTAYGGGKAVSLLLPNSRKVAVNVAELARDIANLGHEKALRRYNLESMVGAPAEEVFDKLTDMLCPAGGMIDEPIARNAMLETIAVLAPGVESFDSLTADNLREFFIGVVSRSIEGKIINEVGTNAIAASPDIDGVERLQNILHNFVERCVRDEFDSLGNDLSAMQGETLDSFVYDLYAASLDLVESLGDDG